MAGMGFEPLLRGLLTERGMSLRALARAVPMDVSHLSRVLNGERVATVQLAQRCEEILGAAGVLQEALAGESHHENPSPQPPGPQTTRVWNVAPPVLGFLGRDAVLQDLTAMLHDPPLGRVRVAVVNGMPGVGKTQLARAFADAHRSTYHIGWWATAETPLEALASLTELAIRLGASSTWTPQEILAHLFETLAERSDWLLLLDNASGPAEIEEFLPRRCASRGHIVITSRSPACQVLGSRIALKALDMDDAARVLTRATTGEDIDDARSLAQELGRLPLALGQAAAYTTETGIGIGDYLALFRQERIRLLECGSASAYVGSVTAAITLSVSRLAACSPLAHRALQVCALWAGDVLPIREILTSLASAHDAGPDRVAPLQAMAALRQSGLLTVDTGEHVRLHRLTRLVVEEGIDNLSARVTDAVETLQTLFPTVPSEPASWPQCARLTPHARAILDRTEHLGLVSESIAALTTRVGRYLLCTGLDFAAARDLHLSALTQRRALHQDHDHPETARALVHLAVDLNELGQPLQARTLHEEALAMRRRLYPEDHPDTAHSLDNLGNVLAHLGDHENARDCHEQGLSMRRRLHLGDHPNIAYSLNNLAADLRVLADPHTARDLDEQALAMRRRLDLGNHPDVAHSLSNLAADLAALGDTAQAISLETRSLDMRQRLYPAGHPQTAECQTRLARMHIQHSDPCQPDPVHEETENGDRLRPVPSDADPEIPESASS